MLFHAVKLFSCCEFSCFVFRVFHAFVFSCFMPSKETSEVFMHALVFMFGDSASVLASLLSAFLCFAPFMTGLGCPWMHQVVSFMFLEVSWIPLFLFFNLLFYLYYLVNSCWLGFMALFHGK